MDDFRRVLDIIEDIRQCRRQSNLELGRVIRDLGNLTQAVSTFSALRLSSPLNPRAWSVG